MDNKGKYMLAGVCAALTVLLILLVSFVDVAPIGPAGTSVGLSRLNGAVHDMTGVNMGWYSITGVLGYATLLVVPLFAAIGAAQLIRRKSLRKMDKEVLALGALYVVVAALYLFFEKFIVNYRPVLMPGSELPEASFPSSHTMLVCVILGSAMMVLNKYVKGSASRLALRVICALVIGVTVIGRLVSGVHWFTDILGGVLISAALLALFSAVKERLR